jgi:poly-gamma-glutamate capsule biosynthesis protein CapA/YwtB (metallophosphatase superfamily)
MNYKLDKKYWPLGVAVLFALAIALGLFQGGSNQSTYSGGEVKLSPEAQKELRGFLDKAQSLAPQKTEQKSTVSFLAVGDIMLSRNVAGKIKEAKDPLLPFYPLTLLFQSVDFSFGNLESPFSGSDHFNPSGSLIFNVPKANIKGLVENNFKVLSLANNHALDQGVEGLKYTIKYLDESNIKHVGTGINLEEAWKPAIIETQGMKVCFVGASYSSVNDGGKTINDYVARIEDIENLKLKIENSKSLCNFVVTSMHAGTEYVTRPTQSQIDFARAAVDAGADIVIGHHPHWVQKIEKYQNKYIFYSLGNFIFDQMWSQETREGLALKIQVSKNQESNLQGSRAPANLESIELIPVIIDNYSTPRLANEAETKKILERIGQTNTILY